MEVQTLAGKSDPDRFNNRGGTHQGPDREDVSTISFKCTSAETQYTMKRKQSAKKRGSSDFRFKVNDYERARRRSDSTWYCNRCNRPAETEHNKPECHLCSDWHECNRDCTLSRVYCDRCKTSQEM